MMDRDEYNTEWLMWCEMRDAETPALDWPAMLALRRELRRVFADSRYTSDRKRAFFSALRNGKGWARDVVAHCGQAPADRPRRVWHGAQGFTVVAGVPRRADQAMEKAA